MLTEGDTAEQVMVPGKQNYSLTWAWSLPYDPVRAVNDALMVIPEDRGRLTRPGTLQLRPLKLTAMSAWS